MMTTVDEVNDNITKVSRTCIQTINRVCFLCFRVRSFGVIWISDHGASKEPVNPWP